MSIPSPAELRPPQERIPVLSRAQVAAGVVAAGVFVVAAAVWLVPTLVVVNVALIVFFTAANVLKLVLVKRGLDDPCSIAVDLDAVDEVRDWPIYTILLPVYRETSVLRQLVHGIAGLDYPADRLDVKLLLEEDDAETIAAAGAMTLPAYFDVCVVPDIGQRGKPRACNYGLSRARGKFLVIYDAEDRAEADQLKKSVIAFGQVDPKVVCLQAKLNYFNRSHNLLTRWFTAEYSMWFDQMLPGLQSIDAAIPLGGTSNHFVVARLEEIGGWNSYNVTEDADLGMRIFLMGWKTAVLDSTTYEEATSKAGNWIRQRSRWVKGYMQTYLFYMRHPWRLLRRMGGQSFLIFQLFFGAGTLCLLVNPIYWLLTIAWFATRWSGIESVFPRPVLYIGTLGLFIGNAAFTLAAVAGCFGRRNYEDVKWVLLFPLYWILMSVAAWKGFIQLLYKPSYWEKTVHGFCAFEDEPDQVIHLSSRSDLEPFSLGPAV
jgi:glycosyltransferase XagB